MKPIEELEGCLEGDDRILFETEHCCAFQRRGKIWFANEIAADSWFESKSLCEIASWYQDEIKEAIRTEFARAEEYYFDSNIRCFRPRRGQSHLSDVGLEDAEFAEGVTEPSESRVYWGLYPSVGRFLIIRQS